MKTYQSTSDASGFYHERSGDFASWVPGTADCVPNINLAKDRVYIEPRVFYQRSNPTAIVPQVAELYITGSVESWDVK